MNLQRPRNVKRNLFIILSLSGCCSHQSPQPNNGVCDIDSSTEFGNTLLTDARRISGNQNITVFTSCKELDELKSGKRNKLRHGSKSLNTFPNFSVQLEEYHSPLKRTYNWS